MINQQEYDYEDSDDGYNSESDDDEGYNSLSAATSGSDESETE